MGRNGEERKWGEAAAEESEKGSGRSKIRTKRQRTIFWDSSPSSSAQGACKCRLKLVPQSREVRQSCDKRKPLKIQTGGREAHEN